MHKDFQWSVHTHTYTHMHRRIHTPNFFWSTYLMVLLNIHCGVPKNRNMSEYSRKLHEFALILHLTDSVHASVTVGQYFPLQMSFSLLHRIQSNVKDCILSSCLFHLYCLWWLIILQKTAPSHILFFNVTTLTLCFSHVCLWLDEGYAFLANKLHTCGAASAVTSGGTQCPPVPHRWCPFWSPDRGVAWFPPQNNYWGFLPPS